jgi:hypothetical protein
MHFKPITRMRFYSIRLNGIIAEEIVGIFCGGQGHSLEERFYKVGSREGRDFTLPAGDYPSGEESLKLLNSQLLETDNFYFVIDEMGYIVAVPRDMQEHLF